MFNLFKKHKNPVQFKMDENTIAFCVDQNHDVSIKISAQNLKKKDAAKFGQVLCFIESGLYRSTILEILQDMTAQTDPERQAFISELILQWSQYIDAYKELSYNKDGPLVPPTKFSVLVNHSEAK